MLNSQQKQFCIVCVVEFQLQLCVQALSKQDQNCHVWMLPSCLHLEVIEG